jgi:hypothetical protein
LSRVARTVRRALTPSARLTVPIEDRRAALHSHSFATSAGAAKAMLADLHY